jgi:addiction module RelE/StbE family toxin
MKVVWTEEAQTHLDGIYRYIATDAPLYAQRVVDKLTRRSEQLIRHPHSGRIVPEYGDQALRELIVFPYRLIYRLKGEGARIDILAVFHGARLLPEEL